MFDKCDYRLDLEDDPALRELYLDAEDDDGYLRDKCVFADDITIEDTMQVQVKYANDVFAQLYALRLLARGKGSRSSSTAPRAS